MPGSDPDTCRAGPFGTGPPPAATVREPDRHRVEFTSTDPDATQAYLAAVYGVHVAFAADRRRHRFHHVRLGPGPFHLDTLANTATIEMRSDPVSAVVCLRMQQGLRTDLHRDDCFGPGDLAVNGQLGEQRHLRTAGALYTAVVLPVQALADAAGRDLGDSVGPLRFASLRPADPVGVRRWLRTLDYLGHSLDAHPAAMAQPLLAGATTQLLAATLLTTFANNWTADPRPVDRTDATPTTFARAVAFIDANADLDITAADISRAARATARAVQLAFRRNLDTTPTGYLRRVRLQRAHEQLRAATPEDGTSVTEVAARWGYPDPVGFTARYLEVFRQLPSQTLNA